jgi:hypothetical protein
MVEEGPAAEGGAEKLPRVMSCLAIGALLAAGFFYFVAESSIAGMGRSDAAGNAMASGFAGLAELALWAALVAFVAIACKGAKLPLDLLWIAVVLALGGAIACNLAVMLADLEAGGRSRLTLALMPVLTVLFAIWARVSAEFAARTRRLGGYALALPALALLVPPFVDQERYEAAAPQREAERQRLEAEFARQEAETAAAYAAEFRAKGPDNRLDDFLQYLTGDFEDEAIAKIRSVRSRQADAVRLMGGETPFHDLDRLHDFDLEPTAELCTAYREALDRRLDRFVPANPDHRGIPWQLDAQFDNYRWLMANGCDLTPQLSRLARLVRSLTPDHFPRYTADLDAIVRQGMRPAE